MDAQKVISGLETAIKEKERYKSDYWRGVRDGYKMAVTFIKNQEQESAELLTLNKNKESKPL